MISERGPLHLPVCGLWIVDDRTKKEEEKGKRKAEGATPAIDIMLHIGHTTAAVATAHTHGTAQQKTADSLPATAPEVVVGCYVGIECTYVV